MLIYGYSWILTCDYILMFSKFPFVFVFV
uniref:Uncharacterized protein n=1 Tax=Rhizophora mucronata TaxID=61149 RepID=A0A2P2M033_RHIMU